MDKLKLVYITKKNALFTNSEAIVLRDQQATRLNNLVTEEICKKILEKLPELAQAVMERRDENENFLQNPDDPKEHNLFWHQFGIITHTMKFRQFFHNEVWEYLHEWQVDKSIIEILSEKIDGKAKIELLEISIPLHDLGKFARGFKDKNGKLKPNYTEHEAKSEKLIRENEQIQKLLQNSY